MNSVENIQQWFQMQSVLRNISISWRQKWNRPFVLFWNEWRHVWDMMLYDWGLEHIDHWGRPVP